MRSAKLKYAVALCSVLWISSVYGEATLFFDETEYLQALTAGGYQTLREGFENDNAWGLVRTSITTGTFSAPDVTSKGVTWNGSGGGVHGVTTSEGAASGGTWGFYSSPHTDLAVGINDGYTVTTPEPMYGFGGHIRGMYGADIIMIVDGDEANPVELGEICELDPMGEPINCVDRNLGNTPFVAIIVESGFSQIEIRETEGGGDEALYIWSDRFNLGFQTLPSNRTPGTRWRIPADGAYEVGANWDAGIAPSSTDAAIFHLDSVAPYTVSLSQQTEARQLVVANDKVAFNLGGMQYDLLENNVTRESLILGELTGDRGELQLTNGTLTANHVAVAHWTNSEGDLQVGSNATFVVHEQLRVGQGGDGNLEVHSGASASSRLTMVGVLAGNGMLRVSDPGSTLSGGTLIVGQSGTGQMTVENSAHVSGGHGAIGVGGDAQVTMDGSDSRWTLHVGGASRGTLRVGAGDTSFTTPSTPERTGILTIRNGATVSAEETYVGEMRNGTGIVNVVGDGSLWESNTSGNLFLGHSGNGVLNIREGGTVQSQQVLIGRSGVLGETRGVAHVEGADSTWQATFLWVGYNSTSSPYGPITDGELNISDGGLVDTTQINIGARNASHGTVRLVGMGSMLTANRVQIGPHGTSIVNNDALLEVGSGSLVMVNQDITIDHGTVALLGGEVQADQIQVSGGQLRGVGLIAADVQNDALVSPGDNLGFLSVDGTFAQGPTGTISVELGGQLPGEQHDVLQVFGTAMLHGTLVINSVDLNSNEFITQPGDLFEVITATAGLTGTFQQIEGVAISADTGYAVTYEPDAVLIQTALLGDANLDKTVDVSDFNIWNAHKFSAESTWTTGDFNGDGLTDNSDFDIWNAHKFTSVGQAVSIPEPGSSAWLWLVTVILLKRRARRNHQK